MFLYNSYKGENNVKILVIGQATLHWGRAEFGNIGNYYVIEPFFRELHRVFPNAKIMTTLQLSDDFCSKEDIEVLPMNLYYGWEENDVDTALIELSASYVFEKTGFLCRTTPYISEVLKNFGDKLGRSHNIYMSG